MKWSSQSLSLILFFAATVVSAQDNEDVTYCRNPRTVPHQNGLWSKNWPNQQGDNVRAICEGTLSVADDNGEICIEGRMTYRQMAEELGTASMFSPASETISLQGHLTAGTGNVVLGRQAHFIYDFVSSYTMGGTDYVAGPDMLDNLLAGSKGTIDKVCLFSNFTQPETFYKISYKTSRTNNVNPNKLNNANIIFANKRTFTFETHNAADRPSERKSRVSNRRMNRFNNASNIWVPDFIFENVPILSYLGPLRRGTIGRGIYSTLDYPQPLTAPDKAIENIQIDVPWTSFVSVSEDGVFTEMSGYMEAVIKRITATENLSSCWKEDTAAIDLQVPQSRADELLEFAEDVLFPKLKELGEVSIHFGKHIPEGSNLLAAAIDKFESCGASVNLTPDSCHHPGCTRSTEVSQFEYLPNYFELD